MKAQLFRAGCVCVGVCVQLSQLREKTWEKNSLGISTNLMKRSTDEDRAAGYVGVKAIRGEAALIFPSVLFIVLHVQLDCDFTS